MELVLIGLLVVSILAAVGGATAAGVQSEQAAQAASDAAKADAKLRAAEASQSARQMRKEHARLLAIQRVQFGKAGVIASVGTPLDVLSENAGELEKEATAVERFGVNVLAFGQAASSSFKAGGTLGAVGAGVSGVGEAAGIAAGGVAGAKKAGS